MDCIGWYGIAAPDPGVHVSVPYMCTGIAFIYRNICYNSGMTKALDAYGYCLQE